RPARPKRPKKGKMGRVLDAWLSPFGFQGDGSHAEAPVRRGSPKPREPAFASPSPRMRGPIIAPDDPSLLNMPKSAPVVSAMDHKRPPLAVEGPQLAPSNPPAVVEGSHAPS